MTLSLLNLALASLFLSPLGSCTNGASLSGGSLLLHGRQEQSGADQVPWLFDWHSLRELMASAGFR